MLCWARWVPARDWPLLLIPLAPFSMCVCVCVWQGQELKSGKLYPSSLILISTPTTATKRERTQKKTTKQEKLSNIVRVKCERRESGWKRGPPPYGIQNLEQRAHEQKSALKCCREGYDVFRCRWRSSPNPSPFPAPRPSRNLRKTVRGKNLFHFLTRTNVVDQMGEQTEVGRKKYDDIWYLPQLLPACEEYREYPARELDPVLLCFAPFATGHGCIVVQRRVQERALTSFRIVWLGVCVCVCNEMRMCISVKCPLVPCVMRT